MTDELAEQVAGVGALVEPARRALYCYVVSRPDAVSRDEAATAVGMPRHSAKFHLDRLEEQGLLEAEFRRLTGRTGPGAGRPAKLYRRSSRQISVSLPERRYDLAGEVLASAIECAVRDGVPVADAVRGAAWTEGVSMAEAHRGDVGSDGGQLERTAAVLARHGYEPRTDDHEIRLANCPFDRLASEHTELVCGMNLALVGGVVDALGVGGVDVDLAPESGLCCVRISDRTARPEGAH